MRPFRLAAQPRERVWGGRRFSTAEKTIGELWAVWEENLVLGGPDDGHSLADLAAARTPELVGDRHIGGRFPLLIKLLDTREWLSVQVHPNDEQARAIEGVGYVGKTEAWHVLEAERAAEVIAGLAPGADRQRLAGALADGSIVDLALFHRVAAGDTVYMPAGTIHALGPGLFVYEVQQSSDITYRVFDWNRPLAAGRTLHLEQTLAVADPAASVAVLAAPGVDEAGRVALVASPYFVLERLTAADGAIALDTGGVSFHAITPTHGRLDVVAAGERLRLETFETVVVPASCGAYRIEARGPFVALLSRLP